MKMIIAIVRDSDDQAVIQQLISQGYRVTRVASTGGFWRRGNVTLLIGVEEEKVQAVINLLRETVTKEQAGQHYGAVFVVNMPHYEQI
jgi:uncharacterized protein YaaQ